MDTRERIRDWMLAVMSRHGWSAEHWGRIAKTSPTNITRFLKADAGFIPSAPTIAKLAAVAGTQPQLYGEAVAHLYRVPILDAITPSLFQSPALAQEIARMSKEATAHVTVPFEVSEGSFAVRCPSVNLSAFGIYAGLGVAAYQYLKIFSRWRTTRPILGKTALGTFAAVALHTIYYSIGGVFFRTPDVETALQLYKGAT